MLGDAYFSWGEALAATSLYEDVVPVLIDGRLAALLGAETLAVVEKTRDGTIITTHGSTSGEHVREIVLFDGPSGKASLQAFFKKAGHTPQALDCLNAASLLIRCTLRRIAAELYTQRVSERLFLTRRESVIAAFIVHGRIVTPYNPGSVAYADAHWGADELVHELSKESSANLWSQLSKSWHNPVDPRWINLKMDIGGGPVELHALGRTDGGAVLFHTPPSREAPTGEVPMLTRRQRDIMNWIAEGKTSAEVAMILDISPRTVEKHLEAVFQRFGVENRVAAVRTYLDLKAGRDPRQTTFH